MYKSTGRYEVVNRFPEIHQIGSHISASFLDLDTGINYTYNIIISSGGFGWVEPKVENYEKRKDMIFWCLENI